MMSDEWSRSGEEAEEYEEEGVRISDGVGARGQVSVMKRPNEV